MTATASANLECIRSISAAWERGDYSSVEWADPDIEFVIADGPEPGQWTGRRGLAPSLLDFQDAWEEYHSEAVEYCQLENEGVLVLTHARGRGRVSGVEMAERRANLFHLRGGKVTRLAVYWNREQALCDAGLDRSEVHRRAAGGATLAAGGATLAAAA
jgi:ketosteroid isomerase-like protein